MWKSIKSWQLWLQSNFRFAKFLDVQKPSDTVEDMILFSFCSSIKGSLGCFFDNPKYMVIFGIHVNVWRVLLAFPSLRMKVTTAGNSHLEANLTIHLILRPCLVIYGDMFGAYSRLKRPAWTEKVDFKSVFAIERSEAFAGSAVFCLPLYDLLAELAVTWDDGDSVSSTFMDWEFFPECVARVPVSLWGSGDWGCVRSTLRSRSQPFATVRARTIWPCLWEVLQRLSFLEVSDVSLLRFAWQAWHFVTFRRVLERVESRFVWQAQYFRDVFTRCLAFFVAGAALWTCPSSFFVAGAAL